MLFCLPYLFPVMIFLSFHIAHLSVFSVFTLFSPFSLVVLSVLLIQSYQVVSHLIEITVLFPKCFADVFLS